MLSSKSSGLKKLRVLGHAPSLAGDSEWPEFTPRTQKAAVWNRTKCAWMAGGQTRTRAVKQKPDTAGVEDECVRACVCMRVCVCVPSVVPLSLLQGWA